MIRRGSPLRIDGDGEQTRDYVHVDDIVGINLFCAEYKERFDGAFYDVGSGESVSLNYIKQFIEKTNNVEWFHAPTRPGDVRNTVANTEPLSQLGWDAKINIIEGLARCFK